MYPGVARFTALVALLATLAGTASAETYLLEYKSINKWVGSEERHSLNRLLEASKAGESVIFHIVMPEKHRELSISRLEILQDILSKSLDNGVTLIERPGETPANTLQVTYPVE